MPSASALPPQELMDIYLAFFLSLGHVSGKLKHNKIGNSIPVRK
jgi:hypothetical protein